MIVSHVLSPRWTPGGDVMVTKTRNGKRWDTPRRIYSMAEEGGVPKVPHHRCGHQADDPLGPLEAAA